MIRFILPETPKVQITERRLFKSNSEIAYLYDVYVDNAIRRVIESPTKLFVQ